MRALNTLKRTRFEGDVIAASLTANMLGLVVPVAMIQIYDRIIPNAATATLAVLAMVVLVSLAADMVLRLARGHILSRAGARFEQTAYIETIGHLFREDSSRSEALPPGQLLTSVSGIDQLRNFHTGDAAAALLDLPFVIIFLVVIALISPVLAATIFTVLFTLFCIVHSMRKRIVDLTETRQTNDARRQSFLIETIKGIETVRSIGVEDFMERRYERLMGTSAPIGAELSTRVQVIQGITAAIGLLAPLVAASTGAVLVMQDQMTIGALAATVLLSGRIVQPVLRIEALLVGEDQTSRAERDLQAVLDRPELSAGVAALPHVDRLELQNIVWQRDENAPPTFEMLNLDLRRGDCVAITGAEGSGRSSLLRILSGEITPSAGEVLANGSPTSHYRFTDRQEKIRFLARDSAMMDGTLLENLTAFQPDKYRMEAFELAQQLGLRDFIHRHRDGLHHKVGPSVSGGLPVSVARTISLVAGLVTRPDVILFDEANAGLDWEADQALTNWLAAEKARRIIVLVSHRPSYLNLADKVYALRNGQLFAEGREPVLNLGRNATRVA